MQIYAYIYYDNQNMDFFFRVFDTFFTVQEQTDSFLAHFVVNHR